MKVLHYIPSLSRSSGGTVTYIQLLAKALGQLVELHIVSHKSENMEVIPNASTHYISSSVLGSMKKDWLSLLAGVKPDIVHINCCWMPQCTFTQKWAQDRGYPVILTPHGMLEPWIVSRNYWTKKLPALLLYQRAAIRNAVWLHATGLLEKENLLKLGYNKNIHIVPNGIDIEQVQLRTSWNPRKKILFLSRIHVKKGIEILLEAIALLREKMNGYSVIIAGEGDVEYVKLLKNRAEQLGVTSLLEFKDGVYGEEKWMLFRGADFFVLPTFSENFGMVIAEALASGTPVITTKGTPWSELEKYECGWWVNTEVNSIADAIFTAIATDEKLRREMGLKGRELIEEKYSNQHMALTMLNLYKTTNSG